MPIVRRTESPRLTKESIRSMMAPFRPGGVLHFVDLENDGFVFEKSWRGEEEPPAPAFPWDEKGADGLPESLQITLYQSAEIATHALLGSLLKPGSAGESIARLLEEAAGSHSWSFPLYDGRQLSPSAKERSMLLDLAQAAASGDAQLLTPSWRLYLAGALKGEAPDSHEQEEAQPIALVPRGGYLRVPNDAWYFEARRSFYAGNFQQVEGSLWPRAPLQGGLLGFLEQRPITPDEEAQMAPARAEELAGVVWSQIDDLSDREADVLDAVSAMWIYQARNPNDGVWVHIDSILEMRGLKKKRGSGNRRGGYEPEQRLDILNSLSRIEQTWLDLAEAPIPNSRPRATRRLQGRLLVATDRVGQNRLDGSVDVEAVFVRFGRGIGNFLLGPGRQVAQLSAQALKYDPYRQRIEKRLLRFLSWHWRIGATKGELTRRYRVSTLVDRTGEQADSQHPQRTRDRLEKALETLQSSGDIATWQYEGNPDETLPRQGWLPDWLGALIKIEAPQGIRDAYLRLEAAAGAARGKKPKAAAGPRLVTSGDIAARLTAQRRAAGLTQREAAEKIGISQTVFSRAERGDSISKRNLETIVHWLRAEDEAGLELRL